MKKILYGLLFVLLTLFFTYITFPFERLISRELCSKLSYQALSFDRFPPKLTLYGLEIPKGSLKVDYLELKPIFLSLLKGKREFKFKGALCRGTFNGEASYPVSKVSFNLLDIRLSRCLNSVQGSLSGKGELLFKGKNLTGGKGDFVVSNLNLLNLNFGLFKFTSLNLGNLKASYSIERENLIKLKGRSSGNDASLKFKGEVFYRPETPLDSYVNLSVKVKVKREPFNGREFSFSIRGNIRNLGI